MCPTQKENLCMLVWPAPLAEVWTHYEIGKLNKWTLFCNVCIDILNSQNIKGNHCLNWIVSLLSVTTTFPTDFSFQNLVFWNLFEFFSNRNHLKINISRILNPKCNQINSIKSCSSRSFQQHQRHIPIPLKFSATI